jgi:endonuclease/exonuclease/phosphatase family metal-dependent hydrolase
MQKDSLKIISLNCWGGRAVDDLVAFFKEKGKDTDVFCLQEVFDADMALTEARHPGDKLRGDLYQRIREQLPDHMGCFAYFDDEPLRMSLALFVRHGVRVRAIADFIVHRPEVPQETGSIVRSARKLQHVTVALNGRDVTIANFHGMFVNGPKTDLPERLAQSRHIRAWLDGIMGPKMIIGDFNLLPDTQSLAILEQGMRNLNKEAGTLPTRTRLYRHFDNPAEPNFADYALVSPDIDVRAFAVLPDAVSDHAPLFVEIT